MAEAITNRGTSTVQLSDKDGLVIMHFEAPVNFVALTPQTAAALSEAMARASYKAKFGDVPTTEKKSAITERIRIKLKNRVKVMLQSFLGEVPAPDVEVQATRVVDACMKELA